MEQPAIIKHHKEIHSYYLFIIIVSIGILVLQPLAMLLAIFMQASMNA